MDNIEIKKVEQAEELIFKGKILDSLKILEPLCEKYPKDGRLAFDVGRCAAALSDTVTAGLYFFKADQLGFKNSSMFSILATSFDINKKTEKAEEYYNKSVDSAENESDILNAKNSYALYFIRHKKYLNAGKIAKELIKNYKQHYDGYHILFLIEYNKGNFDEALNLLDIVSENFKNTADYLTDYIMVSEQKLNPKEMIDLFTDDERFVKNIPNYTLKKEFNYYYEMNDNDGMNNVFKNLIKNHQDEDALFGLALMLYSKKEYEKSAYIANLIIQKYKNVGGLRFVFAVYIQIFNIYHMSEGQLSFDAVSLIEKGGKLCIKNAYMTGLPEFYEPIVQSIEDLFSKVNQNIKQQ